MKRIIMVILVLSGLTIFLAGCYNTERRARRMQESVENIFLDGTGIN